MSKLKLPKSRFLEQKSATNMKYSKLEKGTTLTLNEIKEGHIEREGQDDLPNDIVFCTDQNGATVKLPVRELSRMTDSNKKPIVITDQDSNTVDFPEKVTVVDSEDRLANNEPVFPLGSYKNADKLIKNEMTYNEVVAGGLADPNPYPALQNYTVSVD